MLAVTNNFKTAMSASTRKLAARVELYEGSTLKAAYTQSDALKSITIDRTGEDSKFFGFGVIHKANIKLIDVNRTLNISTANNFIIKIGIETTSGVEYANFARLYVSEVHRDENTNELSITAYDIINSFKEHYVSEVELTSYTIGEFITACGAILGVSVSIPSVIDTFTLSYANGANFEGSETLYEALIAAAEATQTIFYINSNNVLTFKRLDKSGNAVLTISKNDYITLESGANRRLQTICNATELGDNVSASTTQIGTTQYIRDNAFLELREDIAELVEAAKDAIGNITINQFSCKWRGNTALEIGDKIALTTKNNEIVTAYLLNDSIVYEGGLSESSEWNYTDSGETESNPSTLGEKLKQTYARVDKANKQVEITASEVDAVNSAIATLQLDTDSINAAIKSIETNTTEALDSLNTDINTLTKELETKVTADAVDIAIKSELDNGVSKVTTTTGFTLDENGLTISKSGQEMTTNVNEDGITVFRDNEQVLRADNKGVIAYDLHAKTYLIVGETSRFEDYNKNGEERTGCFWIGGGN